MANTSSAKKALRVSEKKRKVNVKVKESYRSARKTVTDYINAGNLKEAELALPEAYKQIDYAVKKGIIHQNTGSRYKSRLTSTLNKAKTA